jgi:hypothetical protein
MTFAYKHESENLYHDFNIDFSYNCFHYILKLWLGTAIIFSFFRREICNFLIWYIFEVD